MALLSVTSVAWFVLAGGTHAIAGTARASTVHVMHDHAHMLHQATRGWSATEMLTALLMWWTMSVAMMLPAAAPAILGYAHAESHAGAAAGRTLRQAALFVAGYLSVWCSFGIAATAVQSLLAGAVQHLPAQTALPAMLAGSLLLAAGLYQFSALKRRCLGHCRSPLAHFRHHWRTAHSSAVRFGWRHGLHCLGCCWALMALMLLTGAMSIGWTAVLTMLMLAERLLPGGGMLSRVAGIGLIGWGGLLVAGAFA